MDKKLYRSNMQKTIGGVCGGLAEYFAVDPVFIRILFIVMFIAGGSGILIYILMWILIPRRTLILSSQDSSNGTQFDYYQNDSFDGETMRQAEAIEVEEAGKRRKRIFGIILITIGVLLLLDNLLPDNYFSYWWPLILVAIGIYKIQANRAIKD